jgi:hypothetical protein
MCPNFSIAFRSSGLSAGKPPTGDLAVEVLFFPALAAFGEDGFPFDALLATLVFSSIV